jgi:two-component system nitrogen regulation sensor histidine kinase NtrY
VRFDSELDASLPLVDLDRDQVKRLLANLLENACSAIAVTGRAGEVVVRTLYDAPLQAARVEVADNGVGIPPEDRRRIFEPYFSTKEHGTGLGLAIVSRIVADHHGYVRVHGNRPHGTRFIVELPVRST